MARADDRDLRPILSPEDGRSIQKLVKDQKTRLKPLMKKYAGRLLDDPVWKEWEEEDKYNLEVNTFFSILGSS